MSSRRHTVERAVPFRDETAAVGRRQVEPAQDVQAFPGALGEVVTVAAPARRFGVEDANLYARLRNAADLRTRIALPAVDEFA